MLIVPSFGSKSFYTPRWAIEYLQKNLIVPAVTGPDFSKKVFVSRQKAAYRRILNEDDVFALFEPLGFKRYNLEDLNFAEGVPAVSKCRGRRVFP
jgi:capsular polysaccharide biosynthesis protein